VRQGRPRQGAAGGVWLGAISCDMARCGEAGWVRHDAARYVPSRQDEAGVAGTVVQGVSRPDLSWPGLAGMVRPDKVGPGPIWLG
jgi:hypothetical protein